MRWPTLVTLPAILLLAGGVYGESFQSADIPDLNSCLKVSQIDFCDEPVPLDDADARERLEKALMLSLWDRPQVLLWLKRSTRYFPEIERMLKESGMPEDLKYLAVAESALRPHAGSSKGAVGFWQFTRQTGRKYGLTIDSYIDERRNLTASTRAAIAYFKDLYALFNSWTTAAAAYNFGEKGLTAEIMEQGTDNYYRLYLPLETQQFVFRIVSIKTIMTDPQKFGFRLSKEDYYLPQAYDRVQVDCSEDTPLRIVTQAADTHYKMVKDLNPQIRGHSLPPGSHTILVPKGAPPTFKARYEKLLFKYVKARQEKVYIVKKGDSLSSIAERFEVPLMSLLIWNRIDLRKPIHPGDRIIVFSSMLQSSGSAGSSQEAGHD